MGGHAFSVAIVIASLVAAPNALDSSSPATSSETAPLVVGNNSRCQNPLFKSHWAGKADIRHLASSPLTGQGLTRCLSYNGLPSCCTPDFEDILAKSFDRWVKHWKRKASNILAFQVEMTKLLESDTYLKANQAEQALFTKALFALPDLLNWYGACFDILLQYMVGMICFACDPLWQQKVFLDAAGKQVLHLNVADSSNEALWQHCRELGRAGQLMTTRVSDSQLAKTIPVQFEDFSMFTTKIKVSQYMAQQGLYPMRGPNERILKLPPGSPTSKKVSRRLASAAIDPVRDGAASGFQCAVFPVAPLPSKSQSAGAAWICMCLVVASMLPVVKRSY